MQARLGTSEEPTPQETPLEQVDLATRVAVGASHGGADAGPAAQHQRNRGGGRECGLDGADTDVPAAHAFQHRTGVSEGRQRPQHAQVVAHALEHGRTVVSLGAKAKFGDLPGVRAINP